MASILPFEQDSGGARRKVSPEILIGRLERAAVRYLRPLLAEMLDQADDAFFSMADKAGSNQQQNLYFEAMRDVRRVREDVERVFIQRLGDTFHAFSRDDGGDAGADPAAFSSDELQLIDDDAMEESVALGNVANKVRNRHGQEVEALHQRLEHLHRGGRLTEWQDPLSPTAIAEAFGEAARVLEGDLQVRLVLFKLFDRHVAGNLLPLYEVANRLLAEAGILPRLRHEVVRPSGEAPATTPDHEPQPAPAAPSGRSQDPESELLSTLHQILGRTGPALGGAGAPATGAGGAAAGGASAAVVGALTGLQQRVPTGTGEVVAMSGARLREQVPDVRSMGPVDDALIDVVAMLFELLLAEDGLPDAAKAQVARLQIPVLKVALLDKTFFGRKGHPARRLLDALIRVGMGGDEQAGADDPALAVVNGAVERVLAEFETDIALFEELADEVEAFLAEEAHREAEAQEAARREAAEREARERAREQAVAAAEELLADGAPEAVARVVGGPWLEVLARARLADDTAAWESAIAFVERLLWSVRPKEKASERRELAIAIPELLATLRQGLAEVSVDRERIDALVAGLEPLHLERFNPVRPDDGAGAADIADAVEAQIASLTELEEIFSEPLVEAGAEPAEGAIPELSLDDVVVLGGRRRQRGPEDEYLEAARGVRVGDWLRVSDAHGNGRRLKVAWKSDLLEEVVLTNWRRQTEEKTLHGLAADFRRGAVELLPGASPFERALERLVARLKGGEAPAGA